MEETLYPVRVVAARTGLTGHVLRAWERRYGIVSPVRSGTNRRLYREEDIRRLQRIEMAVASGHRIGDLASLSASELDSVLAEFPERRKSLVPTVRVESDELLAEAQAAVGRLDGVGLLAVLEQGSLLLPGHSLFERLILPLVQNIGDEWQDGSLRVAHEHLALATLRSFIGSLTQTCAGDASGPELVVGTLSGQQHELGALIVSYLAALQGWRPVYLGPSLPPEELVATALVRQASVIAISLVYPADDAGMQAQILKLGRLLANGHDVTVVAGGRSADAYRSTLTEIGAVVIQDLGAFRRFLDAQRRPVVGAEAQS